MVNAMLREFSEAETWGAIRKSRSFLYLFTINKLNYEIACLTVAKTLRHKSRLSV